MITVVPYNPIWKNMFEEEAPRIKAVLGENCIAVHHIGSTSVPGLAAKPIIDILPVVKDIMGVDAINEKMEAFGYEVKGEYGISFRRFFQKGNPVRTHHVHIFEDGSPEIERHLKFRDWMCAHPKDLEAYANLKQELAQKYPHDRMGYGLGKESFVAAINTKTGFDGLRVVKALLPREWEALRHFRQKYFFDKVPIADPCTWTFDHQDHVHFVLYKGETIVGYAHIQLWADARAALRIIVIEESYRLKGLGSQFLSLSEKWLKQNGVCSLHVQSSPEAHSFYLQHKYIEMPFNDPDGHESDPRDISIGKLL
ncbi:MAG: GNAT family N-acetyltransferase [Alphaproteobacteria bacterium]|nr:GNAT family N-acetyltransferase [Alphaproteobacteria bacterium]